MVIVGCFVHSYPSIQLYAGKETEDLACALSYSSVLVVVVLVVLVVVVLLVVVAVVVVIVLIVCADQLVPSHCDLCSRSSFSRSTNAFKQTNKQKLYTASKQRKVERKNKAGKNKKGHSLCVFVLMLR